MLPTPLQALLPLILIFTALAPRLYCDVGTAAQYSPPYTPTACYGSDRLQFPPNNMFGAAGDGLWDNGAACGRQYLIQCISAPAAGTCVQSQTILVRIVDRAAVLVSQPSRQGATIVLSTTAFGSIANPSAISINVDYQLV